MADKTKKKTNTSTSKKDNKANLITVPRGKPKSGRGWKPVRTERHNAMVQVKSLKTSWEVKMAKKQEKIQFKERIQFIKDEKAMEKQRLRRITEEKRKQKLANERKSEVVQVIKNTAKIKKMKRKHLRSIEIR